MDFDLNKSGEFAGDDTRKSNEVSNKLKTGASPLVSEDDEFGSAPDIARDIERRLEVGNNVEGIEQVYVLYCEYAWCKGFSVRKGCQKYFDRSSKIRMKEYNCSCEGDPDNNRLRIAKMPPPIPLSQDVFYSSQWNHEIEKMILNKLAIEC